MLVIFSGGSGVGKNTVIEMLLKDSNNFALLPTFTTRECRPTESNGNPYYFISNDEFNKKLAEGEFYEHQNVHGYQYGTSKNLLKECLRTGKILLKDIDVLGTQNLVKTIGNDIHILTIFLRVKSKDVLIERLKLRHEPNIEKRLSRYEMEQTYQDDYNYIVTNNNLDETVSISRDIINFEKRNMFLKATQTIRHIDDAEVNELAKLMKNGYEFPPITISIKNGELYIIDGHHRYLASLIAKVKLPKLISTNSYIDIVEQYSWEDAIQYLIGK